MSKSAPWVAREPVEGVVLEDLLAVRFGGAGVRLPSRTSSTSSQSGTARSSRSTSAVPTNPVDPVMAIRFPDKRRSDHG